MSELREELKPRPGEDAVEYAERTEAALERHHKETGERLYSWSMLPGEGPGETLERISKLKEADKVEEAARERRQQQAVKTETSQKRKGSMTAAEESTHRFRIKSQERDVERAVSEFEAAKKKLFRGDGTQVFGEAEHAERLGKLTSELSEKVEAVVKEAEEDAQGYEQKALGLSYTDPTKGLTSTELGRLSAASPLVREDCEGMDPAALVERARAVAAGPDKVAKVLHARYATSRAEAMDQGMLQTARNGGSVSPEDAAALRALREAVSELEAQLEDKETARRRQTAKEAASKSRQLAIKLRRRRSEADGSDERVRQEYASYMRSTI